MTKITLTEASRSTQLTETLVKIENRLPEHLHEPCEIKISWSIEAVDDFFLLNLAMNAQLKPTCQRCMHSFSFVYDNSLTLAVTDDEQRAEQLMQQYEVICSDRGVIDLEHVVTDELHFSVPLFHPDNHGCVKLTNNE